MSRSFAFLVTESDAASAPTVTRTDLDAPALTVGELAAQRGEGVFETIAVVDGHPQEAGAHLERLAHSAALCDLPAPDLGLWREVVAEAAAEAPSGEAVIKIILSTGGSWAIVGPASDHRAVRRDGVRVVTLDRGYDSGAAERAPWLLAGAKTLSYAVNMAALREARRRGADDAIFLTSDGYVLEAPTASLILRIGGCFLTPEPSGGILQGTTQLSAFAWFERRGFDTAYGRIPASDLHTADAAWLVSSSRLAVPITVIDGVPIPVDAALTAELNAHLLSPRG